MTKHYNRTEIYNFYELNKDLQNEVIENFGLEESDAYDNMYVISEFEDHETALPLSMFMRCEGNKFTHGIFSDSAFSGYFLTFDRHNSEAVIAYKYF